MKQAFQTLVCLIPRIRTVLAGIVILVLCSTLGFASFSQPPGDLETTLEKSWHFYKTRFMVDGQRVESNHYGGTITEGQSYALLKAVWMNDRPTFDRTWQWTRRNMQRPDDHLFGWRWGQTPSGSWELLETENAADADQDIAYALLLAGEKWAEPAYIDAARAIIRDLWRLNVVRLHNRYYLSPGTWQGFRQAYLTLNPSYQAPYVYRKFARYDRENATGWLALAQNSYEVLESCSNLTVTRLPPNWCAVQWDKPEIVFSDVQGPNARDFSYDAFRVFWRMAQDAASGSTKARLYLKRHTYLHTYWHHHATLPEGFTPDGQPLGRPPSGFALSAALAQQPFLSSASPDAHYQAMLRPYYHPDGYWFNSYNDYLHSVIWFHLHTLATGSTGNMAAYSEDH